MHLIGEHAQSLAADQFGSAVICGAFTKGPTKGQEMMARALLRVPGLLVFLACSRHGAKSVLRTLQVLRHQDLLHARDILRAEIACLRASRFGRAVAKVL